MISLDAVINIIHTCKGLTCDDCIYRTAVGGKYCEHGDWDGIMEMALHYLEEYKSEQDQLAKEMEYYQKKNDQMLMVCDALQDRLDKTKDLVHCKDCQYYDKDVWMLSPMPIIVGHHRCRKWGSGCQTEPEGFCHMGERK